MNSNLYKLFKSSVRDQSDVAIEWVDGATYSYSHLDEMAARYANLFTGLGLKKGDRVAAQVDKSPENLFLYLACVRAGLVYIPLNVAYTFVELDYFFKNAEPSVMVCQAENEVEMCEFVRGHASVRHVFALDADGGGGLTDAAADEGTKFAPVVCGKDDLAVMVYTSGTTGRPKGAMVTHGNLAANACALHESWGFREGDVLLHALPVFHVHGLFVACHTTWLNGSKMILLPRFDVEDVIHRLPDATVYMGVPTNYVRLLADPAFTADLCQKMRLFTCGSAPLLESTFREFRMRIGHVIVERYGTSETGMNTSNLYGGLCRAGTVGQPLPGVEIKIVGDDDEELTRGETGHLLVRGDNVFPGYWRLPERNKEFFTADSFFRTGDLATMDSRDWVTIVGRSKDLIITGGLNVYPKEVEACIDNLDGVKESAVIGLPNVDFGEAVTAIVVRDTDGPNILYAEVIAKTRESLAGFKVPKQVFFVDELPRNAMSKIQKNVLREMFHARQEC